MVKKKREKVEKIKIPDGKKKIQKLTLPAKELLAVREHSIETLEEYIKLIDMLGGQDETMIRSMFLGFSAESISADRVTFYFYDNEKKFLFPNVTMVYKNKRLYPYDYYSELKDVTIKLGDDICGYSAQTKQPLFIADISKDKRYKGYVDKLIKMNARSAIAIPLIIDHHILGIIEVINTTDNRPLTMIDFYVVSIISHITLITMEKAKLYNWSVTDNLTQLFNYQYLQISMEKELLRAKRYPQDVGIVILDIDNFKIINDKYGHVFGNLVLKGIADIIQETVRKKIDMPVRYGGDEFLLLLPETDIQGAKILAQRLLEEVRLKKFVSDNGDNVTATLSIGVTSAKKNQILDKDKLIHKADQALYKAKNSGKDQMIVKE
ncbi:MAG: sensor domain-containing diguanylate cyclase [Spirochaetes bacterium]|nr:sensor domain-containing diguanylate cyclase [Spirochaetota bacterium]